MPSVHEQMNDEFCTFIDQSRRWKTPVKDIFAPAFFIADALNLPDLAHARGEIPPPPFPLTWIVFRQSKLQNGATTVVKLDSRGSETTFAVWSYAPSGKWGPLDPKKQSAEVLNWIDSLIDACLIQISLYEREVRETDRLTTINHGRAKSKAPIPSIPAFINLRQPLYIKPSQGRDQGRSGHTVSPHERRGHYRRLKKPTRDGRTLIRVRSCSIHTGSVAPRNYSL